MDLFLVFRHDGCVFVCGTCWSIYGKSLLRTPLAPSGVLANRDGNRTASLAEDVDDVLFGAAIQRFSIHLHEKKEERLTFTRTLITHMIYNQV